MAVPSRPLAWVSAVLYCAVLVAGVLHALAGSGAPVSGPPAASGAELAAFVGLLLALLLLEAAEQYRFGVRTPRGPAVVLLLTRVLLFELVGLVDGSEFSRALYVLVPFSAYFTFGRRVSIGLGVAYLVVSAARAATGPGGLTDAEALTDLLMLFIGMVLAVSVAAVAVQHEASRRRAEALVQRAKRYADAVAELSAVDERNRVARDLHDGIGHHLTAIAIQLDKAVAFRGLDPTAADRAVVDARESAGHALQDVRRSVGTLREGADVPLATALDALVMRLQGDLPSVELVVEGVDPGLARPCVAAAYRITQEALTNIRRHAEAEHAVVRLAFDGDGVTVRVRDDGVGLGASADGYGLVGMRERAAGVGGSVGIESVPGGGTTVRARIPARVRTGGVAW